MNQRSKITNLKFIFFFSFLMLVSSMNKNQKVRRPSKSMSSKELNLVQTGQDTGGIPEGSASSSVSASCKPKGEIYQQAVARIEDLRIKIPESCKDDKNQLEAVYADLDSHNYNSQNDFILDQPEYCISLLNSYIETSKLLELTGSANNEECVSIKEDIRQSLYAIYDPGNKQTYVLYETCVAEILNPNVYQYGFAFASMALIDLQELSKNPPGTHLPLIETTSSNPETPRISVILVTPAEGDNVVTVYIDAPGVEDKAENCEENQMQDGCKSFSVQIECLCKEVMYVAISLIRNEHTTYEVYALLQVNDKIYESNSQAGIPKLLGILEYREAESFNFNAHSPVFENNNGQHVVTMAKFENYPEGSAPHDEIKAFVLSSHSKAYSVYQESLESAKIECNIEIPNCIYKDNDGCRQCQEGYIPFEKSGLKLCIQPEECVDGKSINPNKNECVACEKAECFTCNTITNECLQCRESTFLTSHGECVECHEAFFDKSTELCTSCNLETLNCKTCNSDSDTCYECKDGYVKQGDDCLETCKEGYYPDKNKSCTACNDNCKQCISDQICTSCVEPYKVKDGKCEMNCSPDSVSKETRGYYEEKGECLLCPEGCHRCELENGAVECLECITPLYHAIPEHNKCVQVCGIGLGTKIDPDHPNQECIKCEVQYCESCIIDSLNVQKCEKCSSDTYFNEHKDRCVKCDQEYQYIENNICYECNEKCKTCKNNEDCTSCLDPFALDIINGKGVCVPDCSYGEYKKDGICYPCIKNCGKCENNESCDECTIGNIYKHTSEEKSECVECPSGTRASNGECKDCEDKINCSICDASQPDICLLCNSNFYLLEGKCVEDCNTATNSTLYTADYKECKKCPENCLSCGLNLGTIYCNECTPGFFMYNGQCIEECPEERVMVKGQVAGELTCLLCPNDCQRCSGIEKFTNTTVPVCEECPEGFAYEYTLDESGKCIEVREGDITIMSTDPKKPDLIILVACEDPCVECSGKANFCTKCPHEMVPTPDGQCKTCNDLTHIHDKVNNQCLECDKCKTCTTTIENCLECFPNQNLTKIGDIYRCLDYCNKTMAYTDSDQKCQPCPENCISCHLDNGEVICDECTPQTIMNYFTKKCEECNPPELYSEIFNNKKYCFQCEKENCALCSKNKCDRCIEGYGFNPVNDCILCTDQPGKYLEVNQDSANRCITCQIANCKVCPTSSTCEICANGYIMKEYYSASGKIVECVENCNFEEGFVMEDNKCVKCSDKNCINCSSDREDCKVCSTGFYTQKSEITHKHYCTESCNIGSFGKDGKCETCNNICLKCEGTADHCLECKDTATHYLDKENHTCKENCPLGSYPEMVNGKKECHKCQDGCLKCANKDACQICSTEQGFYLNTRTDECEKPCHKGTYPNDLTGICSNCTEIECEECQDADTCTSCHKTCDEGNYLDKVSCTCKPCSFHCKSCENSASECTACAEDYVQQNLNGVVTCTSNCNNGYVMRNKECVQCQNNSENNSCLECNPNNLSECVQCQSSFYLDVDLKICTKCENVGHYKKDLPFPTCEKCSEHCIKCTDKKTCEKCEENMYIIEIVESGITKFVCNHCPSHYFIEENYCKKCHNSCETCINDHQCKTCPVNEEGNVLIMKEIITYEVVNGVTLERKEIKCVEDCGEGLFPRTNESTNQKVCTLCTSHCLSCSNSNSCNTCLEGFVLNTLTGQCITPEECKPELLPGSFLEKNECVQCASSNCAVCKTVDTCAKCDAGFFLHNEQCYEDCSKIEGENLYNDNTKNTCEHCNIQDCSKCKHNHTTNKPVCIECQIGFNFMQNTLDCVKCSEIDGHYVDQSTGECKPCSGANCKSCPNSICEECNENYYYIEPILSHVVDKCFPDCPEGYVKSESSPKECIRCDPSCKTCDIEGKCLTCIYPAQLDSNTNKCRECQNSDEYQIDSQCVSCNLTYPNCEECNSKTCEKCLNNYLRQPKDNDVFECVLECSEGFYKLNHECYPCSDVNCENCPGNVCEKCTDQIEVYLLGPNGTCLTQCPVNMGPNIIPEHNNSDVVLKCENCKNTNCKRCEDSTTDYCEECKDGFFLIWNTHGFSCVDECPEGTIENNLVGKCEICETPCKTCTKEQCLSCVEGKFLVPQTGECVETCPYNMVENPTSHECVLCKTDTQACKRCDYEQPERCVECIFAHLMENPEMLENFNPAKYPDKRFEEAGDITCVPTCSDGYALLEKYKKEFCVKCQVEDCVECSNDIHKCEECAEGLMKNNESGDKCVNSCSNKQMKIRNPDTNTFECVDCSTNCLECKPVNNDNSLTYTGLQTCKVCEEPYVKIMTPSTAEECGLCENSTFYDSQISECIPCTKYCEKCDSSRCIKCKDDPNIQQIDGKCVYNCQDGNYNNGSGSDCQECNAERKCQTCTNESSCDTCPDLAKMVFKPENPNIIDKCIDNCSLMPTTDTTLAFYETGSICQPCGDSCLECDSGDKCIKCNPPTLLSSDYTCVEKCKEGEFPLDGKCQNCGDTCKTCEAFNVCTSCNENGNFPILEGSSCIQECKDSEYRVKEGDNIICKTCPVQCITCADDTAECIVFSPQECKPDEFLFEGTCHKCKKMEAPADQLYLPKEPAYIFAMNERFVPCLVCDQSTLEGHKKCEKCHENNYLYEFDHALRCVSKCPDEEYYLKMTNKGQKCEECPPNCKKCIEGVCEECVHNYVMQGTQCKSNCDPSFYKGTDNKCHECLPHCKHCKDANTCFVCDSPYKLVKDVIASDKCVPVCEESTFEETFTITVDEESVQGKRCANCKPECLTCKNADYCESCNLEIYAHSTDTATFVCVKCDGETQIIIDGVCRDCESPNCHKCSNLDQSKCDVCEEPYKLDEVSKQCKLHCDIGERTADGKCFKCEDPNCVRCDTAVDKCDECKPDYFFLSNQSYKCVKCPFENQMGIAPPKDSSSSTHLCKPCEIQNCLNCKNDYTICEECTNYRIVDDNNHIEKCWLDCPNVQMATERIYITRAADLPAKDSYCEICQFEGCLECSEDGCLSCENISHMIVDGNCKAECDAPGHFQKETEGKPECVPCSEKCLVCHNEMECIQCDQTPDQNFPEGGILDRDSGTCVPQCGTDQFVSDGMCHDCPDKCLTCESSSKCDSCINNLFLVDGQCVSVCPVGSAPVTTGAVQVCEPCKQTGICLECPNKSDICVKCDENHFLRNGVCVIECPVSDMPVYKTDDKECKQCDPDCKRCTGAGKCTECHPEVPILSDTGRCISVCPETQYKEGATCKFCNQESCKICDSHGQNCLEPIGPPYCIQKRDDEINRMVVLECDEGYFKDESGPFCECKKCETVNNNCQVCANQEECEKCKPGSYLNEMTKKCVEQCPEDTFGDCGLNICMDCDKSCDQCTYSGNDSCNECATGYFKDGNRCVEPGRCSLGRFANQETGKCDRCQVPRCERCESKYVCQKCRPGYKVSEDGLCQEQKVIESFFPQGQSLLCSNSIPMSIIKNNEERVGIGSSEIAFYIWIQIVEPLVATSTNTHFTIFETQGSSDNFLKINFGINLTTNICVLTVTDHTSNHSFSVEGGDCSYRNLHEYKYFSLTLSKHITSGNVFVRISIKEGGTSEAVRRVQEGQVTDLNFFNDDTKFVFNPQDNSCGLINISGVHLVSGISEADENNFFYPPSRLCHGCSGQDCDGTNGTCRICYYNISPDEQGYCSSPYIEINSQFLEIPTAYTQRYTISTLFSPLDGQNTQIFEITNPSSGTSIIKVEYENGTFTIEFGVFNKEITVGGFVSISVNHWYGLVINFYLGNLEIFVRSLSDVDIYNKPGGFEGQPPALYTGLELKSSFNRILLYYLNISREYDLLFNALVANNSVKNCVKYNTLDNDKFVCIKCVQGDSVVSDGRECVPEVFADTHLNSWNIYSPNERVALTSAGESFSVNLKIGATEYTVNNAEFMQVGDHVIKVSYDNVPSLENTSLTRNYNLLTVHFKSESWEVYINDSKVKEGQYVGNYLSITFLPVPNLHISLVLAYKYLDSSTTIQEIISATTPAEPKAICAKTDWRTGYCSLCYGKSIGYTLEESCPVAIIGLTNMYNIQGVQQSKRAVTNFNFDPTAYFNTYSLFGIFRILDDSTNFEQGNYELFSFKMNKNTVSLRYKIDSVGSNPVFYIEGGITTKELSISNFIPNNCIAFIMQFDSTTNSVRFTFVDSNRGTNYESTQFANGYIEAATSQSSIRVFKASDSVKIPSLEWKFNLFKVTTPDNSKTIDFLIAHGCIDSDDPERYCALNTNMFHPSANYGTLSPHLYLTCIKCNSGYLMNDFKCLTIPNVNEKYYLLSSSETICPKSNTIRIQDVNCLGKIGFYSYFRRLIVVPGGKDTLFSLRYNKKTLSIVNWTMGFRPNTFELRYNNEDENSQQKLLCTVTVPGDMTLAFPPISWELISLNINMANGELKLNVGPFNCVYRSTPDNNLAICPQELTFNSRVGLVKQTVFFEGDLQIPIFGQPDNDIGDFSEGGNEPVTVYGTQNLDPIQFGSFMERGYYSRLLSVYFELTISPDSKNILVIENSNGSAEVTLVSLDYYAVNKELIFTYFHGEEIIINKLDVDLSEGPSMVSVGLSLSGSEFCAILKQSNRQISQSGCKDMPSNSPIYFSTSSFFRFKVPADVLRINPRQGLPPNEIFNRLRDHRPLQQVCQYEEYSESNQCLSCPNGYILTTEKFCAPLLGANGDHYSTELFDAPARPTMPYTVRTHNQSEFSVLVLIQIRYFTSSFTVLDISNADTGLTALKIELRDDRRFYLVSGSNLQLAVITPEPYVFSYPNWINFGISITRAGIYNIVITNQGSGYSHESVLDMTNLNNPYSSSAFSSDSFKISLPIGLQAYKLVVFSRAYPRNILSEIAFNPPTGHEADYSPEHLTYTINETISKSRATDLISTLSIGEEVVTKFTVNLSFVTSKVLNSQLTELFAIVHNENHEKVPLALTASENRANLAYYLRDASLLIYRSGDKVRLSVPSQPEVPEFELFDHFSNYDSFKFVFLIDSSRKSIQLIVVASGAIFDPVELNLNIFIDSLSSGSAIFVNEALRVKIISNNTVEKSMQAIKDQCELLNTGESCSSCSYTNNGENCKCCKISDGKSTCITCGTGETLLNGVCIKSNNI